ncbi:MAG: electron transport complex subunit RsxE [Acidobacteriota bacterium]|nr:electron transport complex subunit RsxE [Acidobacteriota bacterium]
MSQDGPTALERFVNGILPENPVYRQLLGMCPTLAVTNGMQAAMTMAGATTFVLIMANVITSLIRGLLKPHLRILVFTLTIATFVTIADRFLAAYMYQMSKELGPYIPLIIVNCIIISRCEICAQKQNVFTALSDAVGMGLGFTVALASIATVRELLGSGSWFGFHVLPASWPDWVLMVLPPGAFLTLGCLLGLVNWLSARRAENAKSANTAAHDTIKETA